VTVSFEPSADQPGGGTIEVTYEDYTDDGKWVIDGTERAEFEGGLTGASDYTADLVLSGDHEGYLRADAVIAPGSIDGTIESEVDGRALQLP
jgi:broad specificity polyphosphatase/5'/3'-nucleotidase SurE